jgi:hypothetical protein
LVATIVRLVIILKLLKSCHFLFVLTRGVLGWGSVLWNHHTLVLFLGIGLYFYFLGQVVTTLI